MWTAIHILLLVSILFSINSNTSACDSGWFGKQCQYQCHCTDNDCDVHGECTPGSSCESEWFGPACQYQDLLALPDIVLTPNADVLKDNDDTTCWQHPDDVLTVRFGTGFSIPWIRAKLIMADVLAPITVTIVDENDVLHTCDKTSLQDDRTLDIICDASVMVDRVMVTGVGTGHLCSLHISGGRNVALRQSALQSSSDKNKTITYNASLAVDGKRQSDFDSNSCAQTDLLDPSPHWNVTLSKPHLVNRYVLYNKNQDQDQLQSFILSSFNKDNIMVDNYIVPKIAQAIYYGTSLSLNVSFVKIYTHESNKVLTLCEVEIYGDSLCPFNMYGIECDKQCNCAIKTETCYVAAGGCPSGCAAGFYGQGCQNACPIHKWGVDCLNQCSTNCVDGMCNRMDGSCDHGCELGFTGLSCAQALPLSDCDESCANECSEHCINRSCHGVSGSCDKGSYSYDDRLGIGIGIGIAIMCVVGTLLAVIIICVLMRYRKHRNYGVTKESPSSEPETSADLPKNKYDSLNLFEDSTYAQPSVSLERRERNSTSRPHHKDNTYDEI